MRRSTVARIAPLAIFIAALIANRRAATSLLAWSDTIYDQTHVDRCLADGQCTLLGIGTSIRGVFHAVAWLDLRTMLQWLGIGPTGLLWLVQVSNALAATIVFLLAARLGGLLAGAVATAVLVLGIDLGFPIEAVHNLSVLPFLGAVLTVACAAVVAAPGIATVALAALVAAVTANVHVVGVLTGFSVAGSALAARRHRFLLALVAVAVFSVATVAFAPASWRQNLLAVLGDEAGGHGRTAAVWPRMDVAWWTALALAFWVGSLVTRAPAWVSMRRASIGALTVVLPTLAAVLLAPSFGVYVEAKYLIPVHAACATAVGLTIGGAAAVAIAALAPALRRSIELAAPYGVAIAVASATLAVGHPGETMTLDDLAATARLLRAEQGWSEPRIVRAFTTPARANALTGLLQQHTDASPQGSMQDAAEESATLLTFARADLPDPLPSTWHVLRRSAADVTVLVVSRSPLDWRRFDLCMRTDSNGGTDRCNPVTWDGFDPRRDAVVALPHMPPAGVRWTGTFRLRVPLTTEAGRAGGAVFMPRGFLCGGRIASVHAIAAAISDDRRRVTFAGATGGAPTAAVELEWSVGSADCGELQYDGLPPFLIAGESNDVDHLERILRRRELGNAARAGS